MYAITVTYVIQAGREDDAAEHFAQCQAASRLEPGNQRYDAFRSLDDLRTFVLFEEYDDEAAFKAHRASPHFATHIVRGIMTMMETRTAHRIKPLDGA